MNNSNEGFVDTIDLTEMSFTTPCPYILDVIELLDDSVDETRLRVRNNTSRTTQINENKPNRRKTLRPKKNTKSAIEDCSRVKSTSHKIGDCPICFEELGCNPLASTKCGHVFCLPCLKKSLSQEKKCPTCRCVIKSASDYHPLYLP